MQAEGECGGDVAALIATAGYSPVMCSAAASSSPGGHSDVQSGDDADTFVHRARVPFHSERLHAFLQRCFAADIPTLDSAAQTTYPPENTAGMQQEREVAFGVLLRGRGDICLASPTEGAAWLEWRSVGNTAQLRTRQSCGEDTQQVTALAVQADASIGNRGGGSNRCVPHGMLDGLAVAA